MSDMNSARVAGLRWKTPRMALVTVMLPGFWTPRIVIHKCDAEMTTATPAGSSVVMIASASWLVRRSCSCGRRANISTARASFERPTTRPFGM